MIARLHKMRETANLRLSRTGLLLAALFGLFSPPLSRLQGQEGEMAPLILRGDTTDSLLALLEKLTGRSVIRPQSLPNPPFNFTSQRPMSVEERIEALESLLSLNGVAVIEQSDLFLRVVPVASITGRTPTFVEGDLTDMPDTGGIFTKVFALDFLTSAEFQPLIQPFLSPGIGQIFLFEKANTALVSDTMVNLKRIDKMLRQVDQPSNPNVIVKFYDVEHAIASELVAQVEAIISSGYSKYLNPNSTIQADDRTNQIIVVTHPSNLPVIEQFIHEIDSDKGLSIFNEVIPLRHGDAAEITGILNEIISGQADEDGPEGQQRTRAQTAPDQGQQAQPTPSVTVRGASRAGGDDYGLQFSDKLTIVADERSNSLIVTGTKRDIEQAKQLIREDRRVVAPGPDRRRHCGGQSHQWQ